MKFLQVSHALSAIASLVPGTLGSNLPAPPNMLVSTTSTHQNQYPKTDFLIKYQSTDSSGVLQLEESQLLRSDPFWKGTLAVSFADMNNDGHLDILRGGKDARIWISLNDGSDNFPDNIEANVAWGTGVYREILGYYSVHGVDIDNDGDLDILATGQGAFYWLQNDDGSFAAGTDLTPTCRSFHWCPYSQYAPAVADFNGDGYVDFILGNSVYDPKKPQVFLNDGSGGFLSPRDLAANSHTATTRDINTCDFDQDGNMDIVVAHLEGKHDRVYMNDGEAQFTAVDLPSTLDLETFRNACGDLNGDGYPDLVMADGRSYPVFLNDGTGNFPTMVDLFPNLGCCPNSLALGDFDGDGHIDVYTNDNKIFLNTGNGTFGGPIIIHDNGGWYRDSSSAAFMYSASEPSSTSPTSSPSSNPTTFSPSKTPTGSPTNAPTGSPTQGPSSAAAAGGVAGGVAGGALGTALGTGSSPLTSGAASPSSSAADSLYYPDWTKSNGGCKTGGGQPLYMTLDHSNWMLATLNDCCVRYFGWMLNECKGTSGGAPSGLWYPDWAGGDDTCKDDGSEPSYMALNPDTWMHSSKQECCEAKFSWTLNECLGSGAGSTNEWYIDWILSKCKQDCVDTGPSCGGRAESWDQLFETRSACCAEMAAWNPTECLVD
mmetsp:Transcript_32715/g.74172  ORF Transcript_32715/g.74172 Transcript_32715/m.74172 type:complete len:657 (+) Transcript_32715:288-2258(+)